MANDYFNHDKPLTPQVALRPARLNQIFQSIVSAFDKVNPYVDARMPAGMVMASARTSAPSGWLECNGSAVSRETYADLFSAIGVIYGNGDGSSTFNLPDLRGEFIRGYDNGAGNDPDAGSRTDRGDGTTGDNVGTLQASEFGAHDHGGGNHEHSASYSNDGSPDGGGNNITRDDTNHGTTSGLIDNSGTIITSQGGNETRPRNVSMMWCIKT